jgi:hypothetical protein
MPNSIQNIVRPLIYNGAKLKDYGVDKNTGEIYSFKKYRRKSGDKPRKLKITGPRSTLQYPTVGLSDKTVFSHSKYGLGTIGVHVLVCETLKSLPIPRGTTEKEWKRTPSSVKKACRGLWCVNHIDHDKTNFNPINLEWVTSKENSQAAIKFYKNALAN